MPDIESESEITSHQTANFFKPGIAEVVLYFLLSGIALLLINVGGILKALGGNYIGSPQELHASFTNLSSGFSSSFSGALGGRLGQIILWAFIGAVTYIGLWLVKNVLNSFENDIISAHYLHPSSFSQAGYWGSSLAGKLFLGGLILVTFGYTFIALRAILPAFGVMAGSAVYNFAWQSSPAYLLFALCGMSLVLYIGTVLLRLAIHLWKRL